MHNKQRGALELLKLCKVSYFQFLPVRNFVPTAHELSQLNSMLVEQRTMKAYAAVDLFRNVGPEIGARIHFIRKTCFLVQVLVELRSRKTPQISIGCIPAHFSENVSHRTPCNRFRKVPSQVCARLNCVL